MTARISLAQQIALLSEAAPTDFDPEDIQQNNAPSEDESGDENINAAREHYVDVGPSTLRQMNQASVSDPKYDGARVSRKQLQLLEDEDEDVQSENDGDDGELPEGSDSESDIEDDEAEEEDELPSRVTPRMLPPQTKPSKPLKRSKPPQDEQPAPSENQDLASTLRITREQDRKKGKAVSQQLSLWDSLLDARIRLQKAATAANDLPLPSEIQSYSDDPSVPSSLNAMLEEAIGLSEDLFNLQESLLRVDGSTVNLPRKRAKLAHDGERDYASELVALSFTASEYEAAYHPYLVQTLTKWSAKVQAVAPSVLLPANRGSFKNAMNGKSSMPNVVDVIDDMLRSDADKLLARTRHSRAKETDDGDEASDNEQGVGAEGEVFDDTDFYQQLLRDVIEARGGTNGGEGEQEWVRRQKARKAKRKKTVDTKASKGRKLRYEVHEKLQNFMVPIPVSHGAWHEEQIDELFASLLGAGH